MKIPKYIDDALSLRSKYAVKLDKICLVIDEWLDENGIQTDYDDSHGGVEIYVHPIETEKHLRDFLENI